MKQITIITFFLAMSFSCAYGQAVTDSITAKKVFGGYEYYRGFRRLNVYQLAKAMKPNELAYEQIKKAQTSYAAALVFSYAGGFMIGYPVGTAIAGGEPNWALAGIGAGLIVVAIPLNRSFDKKARQAIDTFNEGLESDSFWDRSELKLSMTENGLGLILSF